ncbi:bifunctional reductase [Streptomyces olivochromogenes]|uniref:assimilatory sulfite reductase (NADPH) n=1 Tax=Streptomyces olivochromogenes TaxID=1963 RepID=A0A250VQM5_STROL|nr:bifunctional reductase [Streptomyces olivochromogenes]
MTPPDGRVPVLPPGAPFDPGHALWVDGVLAGPFSRTAAPTAPSLVPAQSGAPAVEPTVPTRRLVILWASQTGNAEEFAASAATHLTPAAGRTPELLAMADASPAQLTSEADVLLVTSTFGDGDAPDNGAGFWQTLSDPDSARLEGIRYAVLGFGDSNYDDFCGHGRRLDERFDALGATRLLPRTDSEPDFEETAEQWLGQVVTALATADDRQPVPAGAVETAVPEPAVTTTPAVTAPPPAPAPAGFTKASPFSTLLVGNRLLSLPGSQKEVRQFAFDTRDGELAYDAGDALGVWPANGAPLVAEWLALTGLDPDGPVDLGDGAPLPLEEALRTRLDIARITTDLLKFTADRTGSHDLKRQLRTDNKDALAKWSRGRQAADVIAEFPVRASSTEWTGVLKRLQPRLYSIASSPLAHPGEVHLTVSVVRYTNNLGRDRKGVCSTYLADHADDGPVQVFIQRSPHFRPPADPATPMIMVGPGTGVAPFVGFLEDRQARGHTGPNWLFFGEQREATDFYYRQDLEAYQASGHLDRLDLAFSRDQRNKIYVQDRMREHGPRLWQWLQDGAHFYVCGDAARMAKDVDQALKDIATTHGGLSPDEAAACPRTSATSATSTDSTACGGRSGSRRRGPEEGSVERTLLAACNVTWPWPCMPVWPSCTPESRARAKQKRPWGRRAEERPEASSLGRSRAVGPLPRPMDPYRPYPSW